MNKKQKIFAIIGLCLVSFLFLTNIQVSAEETSLAKPEKSNFLAGVVGDVVGWVSGMALGGSILGISYIVGFLASIVVLLGGALTNFALAWNYAILANPIIEVGWQITMGIANLGFVLFIIVIAIATILRFQQYGAKDALGKLIAVALLVNFSLVFAGVFIDFSNMLTRFFINNITGAGLSGLGTALVAPINPQKFLEIKDTNEIEAFAASFGGTLKNIAGAFFSAVFTLITGFCLLAIATMLLVRFVSLSVLLVLAPLACLFIILPATKKLWDQWWGEFMKWILFAPIVSFFFYLTVYLSTKFDEITKGLSLEAQGIGKGTEAYIAFGNIPTKDFFTSVANLVITVGFLIGGLMAANSMGITGSKAFLGVAQSAGKWARGAIRDKGLQWTAGSAWGRKISENLQGTGLKRGGFARAISAPLRGLGTAMSRAGTGRSAQAISKTKKDLEGLTNEQKAIRARGAFGAVAQAAFIEDAAKEGYLDNLPAHLRGENAINILKRAGRDANVVTKARPDWDPEIQKDLKNGELIDAQSKLQKRLEALKPEKWGDLQIEAMLQDTRLEPLIGETFLRAGALTPDGLAKAYGSLKGTERKKLDDKIKASIDKLSEGTGKTREKWLEDNMKPLYEWYTSNPAINLAVHWEKAKEKKDEQKDKDQPKITIASKYEPVK